MRYLKFALAFVGSLLLAAVPAIAQTSPNLTKGQVLTAGQWNALFASKQDTLGYIPLNPAGGTMSGRLVTAAPGTNLAGLNLTPGTTPAAPANGDLWVTSSGIFARINGVTINLTGAASTSFAATSPVTVSFPASVVTYACATCGVTGSPLSQFAATTSAQLAGVISNETGTGSLVFAVGPTIGSPIITTAFTATGLVKNSDLVSASTTVNGQTCTLGSTCTISATAGTITVGTTLVASGSTTRILYNNAGTLGEYTITGTGTVVAMQTSPVFTTPNIGVATGTSLALGTCTLGTDVACIGAGANTTVTIGLSGTTTLKIGIANVANGRLEIAGATSGSLIVLPAAVASGQWTIPSGTTSFVGTDLTQTMSNKTFSGTTAFASANFNGTVSIANNSATGFTVGLSGVSNPALLVDSSTASSATGISIKSAAAGGGSFLAAISSNTNENLHLDGKGSGSVILNAIGTGTVQISRAILYGGVTLSNSVTGTGAMVLGTTPSFTTGFRIGGAAASGNYARGDGTNFVSSAIQAADLPLVANASGAPSATFGAMKCDGVTTTCSSGVVTASGGAASSVQIGTTTIVGGTNTRFLYNNAGTLGEIIGVSPSGTPTANQTAVWVTGSTAKGVGPGTAGQHWTSNGAGVDPSFTSGAWVLLNTMTASNSASLDDTTSFTATYREYMISIENIVPASASNNCLLQVHSGGTFQASSYFAGAIRSTSTTVASIGQTTNIPCDAGSTNLVNAVPGVSGYMYVANPSSTTTPKNWHGTYNEAISGTTLFGTMGGFWNSNAALTGFRIVMGSGNITSGVVRVYGRL
ncbi:hypothetical protein LJR220_003321 [Bradyrhizobium sp. LjRoot220]|uniref:beta strand repeat-containing protein n=1 Tax=Bradyrhizobium sp. LjRoot220 TaxID=3342284 RepID=UPI003ECDC3B6